MELFINITLFMLFFVDFCVFFFHIFSADNLFVSLRLFSSEQKLLYGMYLSLILSVYVLQGKVKYYFSFNLNNTILCRQPQKQ